MPKLHLGQLAVLTRSILDGEERRSPLFLLLREVPDPTRHPPHGRGRIYRRRLEASRDPLLEMAELPAARTRMVATVASVTPVAAPVKAIWTASSNSNQHKPNQELDSHLFNQRSCETCWSPEMVDGDIELAPCKVNLSWSQLEDAAKATTEHAWCCCSRS